MRLDPELVREAERAKEELAVSQHAAYRAKVDYHQAIRRLHAAGGSLREIAEALRMSHQRVHQIIDGAAEPTRRRRGREPPRLSGPVGPCSFCGRPRDVCAKLIAGPGVFICDRCAIQATRLAAGPVVEDQAEGSMRLEASGLEVRCSSCGKEACQGCSWSQRAGGAPRGSLARALGSATSPWTCAGRSWPKPRSDWRRVG